ncbi:MAG TPA: DMT family transporter [Ktedonosporobacter sp.]|nr:DMT family transporter [Ktedonosporobacter sp.]
MHKPVGAYLAIVIPMILIGSSIVTGKMIVGHIPIFIIAALRFALASALLLPLLLLRERKFPIIKRSDYGLLFLQALTGVFLFNVCSLYGLRLTSAAIGGIITSTMPIIVGLLSLLFFSEKITLRKSVGIIVTFLGVLIVNVATSSPAGGTSGGNMLLGNLLMFAAVIGEALYTILGKAVSPRVSPLATATLMSLLGFFMFLPFSAVEAIYFDFSQVSMQAWLAIVYLAIATVIAYYLMFYGISRVSASTAGIFTGLIPISTVFLSYVILGEPVSWVHWVATLCVLIGIGCSTFPVRISQLLASIRKPFYLK